MSAPGPSGQGGELTEAQQQHQQALQEYNAHQKELSEEKKKVELELQVAKKEEHRAAFEMRELDSAARELDEQLTSLKDRVAAVTSELSTLKLNTALEAEVAAAAKGEVQNEDPNLEITTFRELAPVVNKAFANALKSRLGDEEFVDKLSDQNASSRPEFCTVLWQEESAEWKVHDPRDGTEVTFGALLQDVSRYWGMQHEDMCFTDADGAAWPLEPQVWDELGPTGDCTVHLARRPRAGTLEALEYAYQEDESTLPIAVRRKLERERRAKQLERHTKESLRKEAARQRAEVRNELIKYALMMILYFVVTLSRRNVRSAYILSDSMRTVFIEENFGDANEKAYEDIRNYEEFWEWANGPFLDGLLPGELYNGDEIPNDKKRVAYYNRIVGGLRMRQVRCTPNAGCSIQTNVQDSMQAVEGPDAGQTRRRKYVKECYQRYFFNLDPQEKVEWDMLRPTWNRAPYGPMDQTFRLNNATGPAECRRLFNGPAEDETWGPQRQDTAFPVGPYRLTNGDLLNPDNPLDDWLVDANEKKYDMYRKCLKRAYWENEEVLDPDTGEVNITDPLKRAFTWRTAEENTLKGAQRAGRYSTYDGSGFVYDLTNLTTTALSEAFGYLEENNWLDRQTRALFISLVVYNANYNLYAVCNFNIELSLAGVLTPRYDIKTVKMDLWVSFLDTVGDTTSIIIEGILYLGMVYYLLNEFVEVYNVFQATGGVWGYFSDFWNVIDWSLIMLSFYALLMRVLFVLHPQVRAFSPFAETYTEITGPSTMYNDSFAYDAIAATFGILKIFRFFDLQRNLLLLREASARGVGDLVTFTGMLLVIIAGFAFAGMSIFGQENPEYTDFLTAFITLFLTMLGEFDFEAMIGVDFIWALFFFFLYQTIVFLVMLNIFLAILNDAYIAIKMKFDAEEIEEAEAVTLTQRLESFRQWLRQRKLDKRIEALRKEQRLVELAEKRAARKVEEARARTLKGMGVDPTKQPKAGGAAGGSGGNGGSALDRQGEL